VRPTLRAEEDRLSRSPARPHHPYTTLSPERTRGRGRRPPPPRWRRRRQADAASAKSARKPTLRGVAPPPSAPGFNSAMAASDMVSHDKKRANSLYVS
jgi:hypothetical protein